MKLSNIKHILLTTILCALTVVTAKAEGYVVNTTTANSENKSTITITERGCLSAALATLTQSELRKIVVVGELNDADVAALANVETPALDISRATGFTSLTNNNQYVKNVVLPISWTKAQVNAAASKFTSASFEAAASVAIAMEDQLKWVYGDPKTIYDGTVTNKTDGDNENSTGKGSVDVDVPLTVESSSYTYNEQEYVGSVFNMSGNAYGIPASPAGTIVSLTNADINYTYGLNNTYAYTGSEIYTNGVNSFFCGDNSNVIDLQTTTEYHTYGVNGSVYTGSLDNITGPYTDNYTGSVYYKGEWDVPLYPVIAYVDSEERSYTNTVYEKDGHFYGYTGENPFVQLTPSTQNVYYYVEDGKNVIFNGMRNSDNSQGYTGNDAFELTTSIVYSYINPNTSEKVVLDPTSEAGLTTKTVGKEIDVTREYVSVETSNVDLTVYVNTPGKLAYTLQHVAQLGSSYAAWRDTGNTGYWCTDSRGNYGYNCSNVKNLTVSGTVNAIDLNNGAAYIGEDGHFTTDAGKSYSALGSAQLVSIDLTDAITDVDHQNDMTLSFLGIFADEPGYEQHVYLPTSPLMTEIPANMLENLRGVHNLCIPQNYRIIRQAAFKNSGISHITTTSPAEQTVNDVTYQVGDEIDMDILENHTPEYNSWTLPPFLTLIETEAFQTTVTGGVSDVYIYANPAPKCQMNAFPEGMYTGWGGFHGNTAHPIQRTNYENHGFLFTILHFPSGLTDLERMHYTDITRQYSFVDETGATDDDGNIKFWPSMNQFYRSYDQAVAGVTWDAWETSRDYNDYSQTSGFWDPSVIYKSTSEARTGSVGHLNTDNLTSYEDAAMASAALQFDGAGKYLTGVVYDPDYTGWHQFVLVGSTNFTKPDSNLKFWNFSAFKENDWYTICVPFDMTKSDLVRIFGSEEKAGQPGEFYSYTEYTALDGNSGVTESEYNALVSSKDEKVIKTPAIPAQEYAEPDVRTLVAVKRDKENLRIHLDFGENLMEKYVVYNTDGTDIDPLNVEENISVDGTVSVVKDGGILKPQYAAYTDPNPVVIKANMPYLIKPRLPEYEREIANAGNRAMAYTPKQSGHGVQSPNPCIHVNAFNGAGTKYIDWQDEDYDDVPSNSYRYYFVGTYLTQPMPQNCYYLSKSKSTGLHTLFRNTKSKTWTMNTCVIGGVSSTESSLVKIGGSKQEHDVTNFRIAFTPEDDFTFEKELPAQAKAMTFIMDFTEYDNTVTEILLADGENTSSKIKVNDKVYNLNGQYMGNSMVNLPKGVYVVNGKKIAVK